MAKIKDIELGDFPLFLSPMDDVTDQPFRALCKQHGADVLISEFIASEALIRDAEKSLRKMRFDEAERPIGIQIFGSEERSLLQCLDVVQQAKPDFIDLNWGCPVRKVAGKGAGSGMLRDIPKLLAITASVVRHATLPVTVKTRLGYDETDKPIVQLAEQLQDVGVAAISIHGRTKSQMYRGQADWTLIAETKANPRLHIPVFGNGDLTTPQQVLDARRRYGVDGVLIGRAAIGNPWIFEQSRALLDGTHTADSMTLDADAALLDSTHATDSVTLDANAALIGAPSVQQRVAVCRQHLLASVAFKGERQAIFEMRKHYGGYFHSLFGFKPFRIALVTTTDLNELLALLDRIAAHYATPA